MTSINCDDVRASAAEFALGLGDGAERADVVNHLAACPSCRHHVEALTVTADAILIGGPVVEPPAGFEERVIRATAEQPVGIVRPLRPSRPARDRSLRRNARRWVVAAAAVALIVFGTGLLVGRLSKRTADGTVRSAAMLTPDGRTVGRVEVGGDPDTVFVAVPGWRPRYDPAHPAKYRLRLTLTGGRSQLLGPVHLGPGDGSWGTVLPVDAKRVRSVALVGENGRAYCMGSLA